VTVLLPICTDLPQGRWDPSCGNRAIEQLFLASDRPRFSLSCGPERPTQRFWPGGSTARLSAPRDRHVTLVSGWFLENERAGRTSASTPRSLAAVCGLSTRFSTPREGT